jgi:hypothetical protein
MEDWLIEWLSLCCKEPNDPGIDGDQLGQDDMRSDMYEKVRTLARRRRPLNQVEYSVRRKAIRVEIVAEVSI